MDTVLGALGTALEFAVVALEWSTLPLLVLAIVLQIRRGSPLFVMPGVLGGIAMLVVGAAVVIATITGAVAGVSVGLPATGIAAWVLLLVLLRNDQQFWCALAVLTLLYTAIGYVSVLGFAHAYESATGGWRGARLLVAWGGPSANPTAAEFGAAHWHLALVRYGIPLSATVAVGWLLATRRALTRIERTALVVTGGSFLSSVLVGALLSAVTFAVGLTAGLPLLLGIVGLIASFIMLISVGPGAIAGIVIGIGDLVRATQPLRNAHTLVTTVRASAADGDPTTGPLVSTLARFLAGGFGWVQKLSLIGVALLLGFVLVNNALFGMISGDAARRELTYERVVDERALSDRIRTSGESASGGIWLLTADDRLRHFDPVSGALDEVVEPVSSVVIVDDRVLAATAGTRPTLLAGGSWNDLAPVGGVPLTGDALLASDAGEVYLADHESLRALAADGSVRASVPLPAPVIALGLRDGEPWTFRIGGERGFIATRHDPSSLVVLAEYAASQPEPGYLAIDDESTFSLTSGRFLTDPSAARDRWTAGFQGALTLTSGESSTRFDFHYDLVTAVYELDGGTWLITMDDPGLALTPRDAPRGYIVRWPAAPPRDAG